jgi:hypothetical protein
MQEWLQEEGMARQLRDLLKGDEACGGWRAEFASLTGTDSTYVIQKDSRLLSASTAKQNAANVEIGMVDP